MSEVTFAIANRNVATVRLDPNAISGRDKAGLPELHIPLKLQLLPAGEKSDVQYTVVRLAGVLQQQPLGEFAKFETAPLALVPSATPFDRPQDAFVALDRLRIRRFEDARAEGNAHFQIALSALVWYPEQKAFESPYFSGPLDVRIPKSHWIEVVLAAWNLSNIKLVEIQFSRGTAGENFRAAYARVEEAEKQFASGQYKHVLTSLRLAFEGLAKSLDFKTPTKDFFESLFASVDPDKKGKLRDALDGIYRFFHLGPHEQVNDPNSNSAPTITRQDARFALIMAHAIFEYITPHT